MAYQGVTIPLPIGAQGFTGSRNPSQMEAGHLPVVNGLQFSAGILEKEGGAVKLNSSALAAGADILAGVSWYPVPETKHDIVFTGAGSVLRDAGGGTFSTVLVSGLNVGSIPPTFVKAGGEDVGATRKLFLFTDQNQVQMLQSGGATMAAIASPPADWASQFPTFGVLHDGRMFSGGNGSDPHRIYYSLSTDHQDYTSAGSGTLPVFPGEGERLVGGVSYRGLLILFKYPAGLYVVETNEADPTAWKVYQLSSAVGGVNQQAIVLVENDVLYLDHGGNFHLMSATAAFGDVNTSNIGLRAYMGDFMINEVALASIRNATGIWYPARRQAWFAVPGLGSTENNLRIVVDFNRPDIGVRFLLSNRDIALSMWTRPDDDNILRPAIGDSSGFVWLLDQIARNKAGSAYEFRLETANTDLGFANPELAYRYKNGQFLELVSEPRGDWDLTVRIYWDDILTDTVLYNMGGTGAALGDFILDINALSSEFVRSDRKRIAGSGRRIKLQMENDGLDQDVAIAEFFLAFDVADERTGP